MSNLTAALSAFESNISKNLEHGIASILPASIQATSKPLQTARLKASPVDTPLSSHPRRPHHAKDELSSTNNSCDKSFVSQEPLRKYMPANKSTCSAVRSSTIRRSSRLAPRPMKVDRTTSMDSESCPVVEELVIHTPDSVVRSKAKLSLPEVSSLADSVVSVMSRQSKKLAMKPVSKVPYKDSSSSSSTENTAELTDSSTVDSWDPFAEAAVTSLSFVQEGKLSSKKTTLTGDHSFTPYEEQMRVAILRERRRERSEREQRSTLQDRIKKFGHA